MPEGFRGRIYDDHHPVHRPDPAHPPCDAWSAMPRPRWRPRWRISNPALVGQGTAIGVSMIDAAERDGKVNKGHGDYRADQRQHRHRPGVSPAPRRGYKLVVTMPETMSLERRRLLKALLAQTSS